MAKTQQGNPDEGESNDIGTAFVREAGCGVMYVINLEDMDEEQFVVEMNREQTIRLFVVLGKLLGEVAPPVNSPPPALPSIPWAELPDAKLPWPNPVAPPPWTTGSVTFPPNYPNHPGWRGTSPGAPSFNPWNFRW